MQAILKRKKEFTEYLKTSGVNRGIMEEDSSEPPDPALKERALPLRVRQGQPSRASKEAPLHLQCLAGQYCLLSLTQMICLGPSGIYTLKFRFTPDGPPLTTEPLDFSKEPTMALEYSWSDECPFQGKPSIPLEIWNAQGLVGLGVFDFESKVVRCHSITQKTTLMVTHWEVSFFHQVEMYNPQILQTGLCKIWVRSREAFDRFLQSPVLEGFCGLTPQEVRQFQQRFPSMDLIIDFLVCSRNQIMNAIDLLMAALGREVIGGLDLPSGSLSYEELLSHVPPHVGWQNVYQSINLENLESIDGHFLRDILHIRQMQFGKIELLAQDLLISLHPYFVKEVLTEAAVLYPSAQREGGCHKTAFIRLAETRIHASQAKILGKFLAISAGNGEYIHRETAECWASNLFQKTHHLF